MRTRILTTAVIVILLVIGMAGVRHIDHLEDGIKLKQIEIQDNSAKLKLLDKKYDELNKDLEKTGADKQKLEQDLQKLQEERLRLEKALQAKKEQKERDIAVKAQRAVTGTAVASAATGEGCDVVRQIMSSKGFSGAELEAAVKLSQLESGCRSNNNNPSSNACNFFQEWPCGKWGGNHNTEAHINGAIGYMQASYGSWQNALYKWYSRSPHWW